jgi:hypothetical protein
MTYEVETEEGEGTLSLWHNSAISLWEELASPPGRLGLLVGDADECVATDLAETIGAQPVSVGLRLASCDHTPSTSQTEALLRGAKVLVDVEVLLDPVLRVAPLRLLRDLARLSGGVTAGWPGIAGSTRLSWGEPGQYGYFDEPVEDLLLLTCGRSSVFTDEPPFTITRYV